MNDQTRTPKQSLILMVDDNPDNLQALGNLLEKHYKTAVAMDGFETLAFVEQKTPDLILLDIMMPGMTGYEVCERLKGDPKTSDIPILFISAMAEVEDKVEAFSRGGVDYITKPFQSKEVLARVATHLAIRNMRLDLEEKNEQLLGEIRKRKRIEEELFKTKKHETAALMADGIAHDFNNLLSIIMGNVELALDMVSAQDELWESLVEADKASLQAKDLVRKFLDFSNIMFSDRIQFSLCDLIKKSISRFYEDENIGWELDFPDPDRKVEIDLDRMRQAIGHILKNAREAMPDGGTIRISVTNHSVSDKSPPDGLMMPDGDYLRVCFSDDGTGISADDMDKIFDPYFSTRERGVVKGQGLGLTAVYSIIKSHEGWIKVESEPAKGTDVIFYIPQSASPGHGQGS